MAQGAAALFNEFLGRKNDGTHDLDTHVVKVALITTLPVVTQATPQLSDYTEVTGSNYTAGGITLTVSVSLTGNVYTFDFTNDPEWIQHASGPNNIVAALIYNDTDASKRAIGFVDLTTDNGVTPISLQTQNIKLVWGTNGFFTETRT